MKMKTSKISYRIGGPPGQQAPRSSVGNQAEGEKLATGTKVLTADETNHNEETQQGTHSAQNQQSAHVKEKRQKWSKDEYADVIEAFYEAETMGTNIIQTTYDIWRKKFPTVRPNMDANKLSATRRFIINTKKLTATELDKLRMKVRIKQRIETENQTTDQNNESRSVHENNHDAMHDEGNFHTQTENNEREAINGVHTDQVYNNNVERESTNEEDQSDNITEEDDISQMKAEILRRYETAKETPINERIPIPKVPQDKKTKEAIATANAAIQLIKIQSPIEVSLTNINHLLYATGCSIAAYLGIKVTKQAQPRTATKPQWQNDIEKEIQTIRGDISALTEIKNGKCTKEKKRNQLFKKHKIKNPDDITATIEKLKQIIQAKAQRIRRFTKRNKFYQHNKLFKENAKKFYRNLGKKTVEIKEPPNMVEVETFWSNIWEKPKFYNREAVWINKIENELSNKNQQEWLGITLEETKQAIMKSSNWKTPGNDQIANFWLKSITSLHQDLSETLNECIANPNSCPAWLTTGITYLLPKTENTKIPKNYRPITCLPTTYKILTSILTEKIYEHLDSNGMLPIEQKGCRRGSYGCKDQLLINKAILEEVRGSKKNLTTAWIDYKKAFDSVPHDWILKSLNIYKISPIIIQFIAESMKQWSTTLTLSHAKGQMKSRTLKIKSGIFQGDSLSPLLFCVALAPLSSLLNETGYGYKSKSGEKINHLFYMDDLKTYTQNENEQSGILHTVKTFSDDILMEFGLDKCAKATFRKGKLTTSENIQLDVDTVIQQLEPDSTYKYLGINEGDGIQHASMKEKIKKEYYRRIRLITKSELNATNRIEAMNTLAVPVVSYSFNIIDWTEQEIQNLDRKTRKILAAEKMHHPKADVDRIYIKRAEGGRSLVQLEATYKATTIGLDTYLQTKDDHLLKIAKEHEEKKNKYSVVKQALKFKSQLDLANTPKNDEDTATSYAKRIKKEAQEILQKQLKEKWTQKEMHGQYPKRLQDGDVDNHQSNKWLKTAGLKAETEGLIIAAQDQAIKTKYLQAKIIKDGSDPNCRICGRFLETVDHITSGCPELAKTEYLHRHNRVASYVHWSICKSQNIQVTERWYEHDPKTVIDTTNTTIIWDMPVHTDREIRANRPDIILKCKDSKRCMLIDISIPNDKNTSIKVVEKLSKYKDLEIETERMWGMKTTTIPVVIGALGIIKKGTEEYIKKIPGNIKLQELQKTTLLGTAHILRKVLSMK